MLKHLLGIALIAAVPAIAQAKTFKLGGDKPSAEITIPDAWTTESDGGTVEAMSSDKETYLSADAIDAKEVADVGKETAQFLASQKIKVKPETKKAQETKVAGFPTVEISWDATDEDGPTRIRLSLVKLSPETIVVFTYWRSEAAETHHGTEVAEIEKSLRATK